MAPALKRELLGGGAGNASFNEMFCPKREETREPLKGDPFCPFRTTNQGRVAGDLPQKDFLTFWGAGNEAGLRGVTTDMQGMPLGSDSWTVFGSPHTRQRGPSVKSVTTRDRPAAVWGLGWEGEPRVHLHGRPWHRRGERTERGCLGGTYGSSFRFGKAVSPNFRG